MNVQSSGNLMDGKEDPKQGGVQIISIYSSKYLQVMRKVLRNPGPVEVPEAEGHLKCRRKEKWLRVA